MLRDIPEELKVLTTTLSGTCHQALDVPVTRLRSKCDRLCRPVSSRQRCCISAKPRRAISYRKLRPTYFHPDRACERSNWIRAGRNKPEVLSCGSVKVWRFSDRYGGQLVETRRGPSRVGTKHNYLWTFSRPLLSSSSPTTRSCRRF